MKIRKGHPKVSGRLWRVFALAGGIFALVASGNGTGPGVRSASAASDPAPPIVRLVGVGMTLTADGTLWVYRPDESRWMTIDDSFREEGRQTRILPLPVAPDQIREMATWGFLLTQDGTCWLYDIQDNKWNHLPAPGK